MGPSVGGQRPRNNNFSVEGVDNNRKDVTGHNVDIPNEAVAEFSMLENQYSAEYGNGTGGQFNTVLRGGTNEIHGAAYEYLNNRNLNALDESFKRQGILTHPRYDQNTFGGSIGGPGDQEQAVLLRPVSIQSLWRRRYRVQRDLCADRRRLFHAGESCPAFRRPTWESCSSIYPRPPVVPPRPL